MRSHRLRIGLGLVSVLVAVPQANAQHVALGQAGSARITVRPKTMATGTKNPAAGTYPIDTSALAGAASDSSTKVLVTVPRQCVGAHRCPLLIQLPGGGLTAEHVTKWLGPVANTNGFLLLATTTYTPRVIDAALHEALRRFAVDPNKIAIVGRCASGQTALLYGVDNPDVFTRTGSISGDGPLFNGIDPHNTTTQFYIDDGMNEATDTMVKAIAALRQAGHPAQQMITIRSHEDQAEDYVALGRWLHDSWATPNPSARPAPRRLPDPLPVLTTQALTQLTTFWTRFFQEPDSIHSTARMAYDRPTVLPLGAAQPWTVMVDMPALAAHVPAVAADLRAAGLTAAQHDAYRLALLSALVARNTPALVAAAGAQSVLAQNVAFLDAHKDELKTLAWAGVTKSGQMWEDGGVIAGFPQWHAQPEDVRAVGPMGIWRTP